MPLSNQRFFLEKLAKELIDNDYDGINLCSNTRRRSREVELEVVVQQLTINASLQLSESYARWKSIVPSKTTGTHTCSVTQNRSIVHFG